MEMIEQWEKIWEVKYRSWYIQSLQEAIERINNQP
jgi:hypothetical protein